MSFSNGTLDIILAVNVDNIINWAKNAVIKKLKDDDPTTLPDTSSISLIAGQISKTVKDFMEKRYTSDSNRPSLNNEDNGKYFFFYFYELDALVNFVYEILYSGVSKDLRPAPSSPSYKYLAGFIIYFNHTYYRDTPFCGVELEAPGDPFYNGKYRYQDSGWYPSPGCHGPYEYGFVCYNILDGKFGRNPEEVFPESKF